METALAISGIAMAGPPFVEALIKFGEYLVDRIRQHRQIGDQVELCTQIITLNQTQSRLLFVFLADLIKEQVQVFKMKFILYIKACAIFMKI